MKKTFLILSLLVTSIILKAQGNLQFNQVKLVSTIETVPIAKIWKVESCSSSGGAPFCVAATANLGCGDLYDSFVSEAIMSYKINGNNVYIFSGFAHMKTIYSANVNYNFPLWLPAGATLAVGTNMKYLSVIEFNIVQ